MEVVDHLILDTFHRFDESFFDSFSSPPETINELSTDQVYEGIVLLLWACDPSLKNTISSVKLPGSMTSRFRAATNVVDAIKAAGVRDEVGYQTLLYGQPKELRNVIIGLIEKLPKESPVLTARKDPFSTLAAACLSNAKIKPPFSSSQKYAFLEQRCWKPSWGTPRRVEFMGHCGDVDACLRLKDWKLQPRSLACTLLEWNRRRTHFGHSTVASRIFTVLRDSVGKRNLSNSVSVPKPPLPLKRKPPLPAKPTEVLQKLSSKAAVETKAQEEVKEAEDKSKEAEEALVKLAVIMDEISALRALVERKNVFGIQLQSELMKDVARLEELKMQESGSDVRLKNLIEMPDAAAKLAKYVDDGEERMEELQNRWIAVKEEREGELKLEREKRTFLMDPASIRQETSKLLDSAAKIEQQLSAKENYLSKLKAKVETMEDARFNRSAYTKRIFDIVANIKKQQEEISKVLNDNQFLQKEIKSVSGKLDRTFTVVEESFYRDSQRDASMQKAYRLLVKIHEGCSWVVSAIEASGCLNREMDEINDQIVIQQQKGVDATLEKVLNDWMQVKQENTKLEQILAGK